MHTDTEELFLPWLQPVPATGEFVDGGQFMVSFPIDGFIQRLFFRSLSEALAFERAMVAYRVPCLIHRLVEVERQYVKYPG
jgi:hypothetical protein